MRTALLALALLPTAAVAQTAPQGNAPAPIVQPGQPVMANPMIPSNSTVVVGGAGANSGPGASTTIARSGTGAATVMTDSAAGGNAEQQTRGVPQGGGGGSGGSR